MVGACFLGKGGYNSHEDWERIAEVIESAPGIELGAGVSCGPINQGITDAVIEAIPVLITWYRRSILHTKNESLSGDIPADGTWRSDQTKEENQL